MPVFISKDRVDNIPTKRMPPPIRREACLTSSFKAVIYTPEHGFIKVTDAICTRHKCQLPSCRLAEVVAV